MIDAAKFLELSRQLEDHHAVFYTLWQLGKPVSDPSIPTACVSFDKEGECLKFAFNPDFWDRCTDYDKLFVICHESMHVILRHGVRAMDTKDTNRCNIALDLVVNHMLVNKFGFDRTKLTDWESLIWVDTIFPDQKIADDLSYEEYFQMVPPQPRDTLDSHNWKNTDSEKLVGEIAARLGNEEKEALKSIVSHHSAGTEPGKLWCFADKAYVPPKKKWETVIKKWAKKYNHTDHNIEQWARLNRRYACLQSDFILPTEMEVEHESQGKIGVWFFQDTSASCYTHRNRFFSAAKSLPKDRFDVKLHCFDTKVYETTIDSGKLYGFGGTAFQPIEQYIQQHISANKLPYPQAVFVISDGVSCDKVCPEKPNRWYFFLSTNYVKFIPEKSKVFMLKDFE